MATYKFKLCDVTDIYPKCQWQDRFLVTDNATQQRYVGKNYTHRWGD